MSTTICSVPEASKVKWEKACGVFLLISRGDPLRGQHVAKWKPWPAMDGPVGEMTNLPIEKWWLSICEFTAGQFFKTFHESSFLLVSSVKNLSLFYEETLSYPRACHCFWTQSFMYILLYDCIWNVPGYISVVCGFYELYMYIYIYYLYIIYMLSIYVVSKPNPDYAHHWAFRIPALAGRFWPFWVLTTSSATKPELEECFVKLPSR